MNKTQVAKVLASHRETITSWLSFSERGVHHNTDKMKKALECVNAGAFALEENKLATAIQHLGFVRGILYAVGVHTWEYLQRDGRRDDER